MDSFNNTNNGPTVATTRRPYSSEKSDTITANRNASSHHYSHDSTPLATSSSSTTNNNTAPTRRTKVEYPHEGLPMRLSSVTHPPRASSLARCVTKNGQTTVSNQAHSGDDKALLSGPMAAQQQQPQQEQQFEEVTFFQDFVAGGIAGSASVIVGHPFDTIKVRVQASANGGGILNSLSSEFGGISSLFRGMATPLASMAVVNAVIFSSYGSASKIYDNYITSDDVNSVECVSNSNTRDPWQKSTLCGAFAVSAKTRRRQVFWWDATERGAHMQSGGVVPIAVPLSCSQKCFLTN